MKYHVQALPEGTRIAGCRIVRFAGASRFGFVYEARRELARADVLVRELFPRNIASRGVNGRVQLSARGGEPIAAALDRLERLASRLQDFHHPHCAQVLNFSRENGSGYLVSGGGKGESLEHWLQRQPSVPTLGDIQRILDPVLDAVSALHAQRLVHQDISPETILLPSESAPLLCGDLGLADIVAFIEQNVSAPADTAHASSAYVAPEQLSNALGLGPRTDVYAVGAVFYRALCGKPPCAAADRRNTIATGADPYVPLADVTSGRVPEGIARAVDRALSLHTRDRPASIDELRIALGAGPRVEAPLPYDTQAGSATLIASRADGRRPRRADAHPRRALSLQQLRSTRAQTPVVPIAAASPRAVPALDATRKWSNLSGLAAGFLALVGVGLAAVQIESGRLQSRLRPGDPEDSLVAWADYLLIGLAALLIGGAAWSYRDGLDGLVNFVKSRLRRGAKQEPEVETVEVSAFAPSNVLPGGSALIQVYLHAPDAAALAGTRARAADSEARERGIAVLREPLRIGQRVHVTLEAPGLRIADAVQSLVWNGQPTACQFLARVPRQAAGKTFQLCVRLLVEAIPVGTLRFTLGTSAADAVLPPRMRGERAHRYNYAFLSYASADRAEVIKRAQTLRAARIDFFHDLLTLEPGERWESRLFQEIDRCDLFLLFWSSHAAKSDWVIREAEYALKRSEREATPRLDITPIVLEGPPVPSPPSSLRSIHFNDPLRYVIAAAEGERR
jgi:serine/threonine protein kinase